MAVGQNMRSLLRRWKRLAMVFFWVGCVVLHDLGGSARCAVVNTGFDLGGDGLQGWTVRGTIFNTGQQAVLSEQGVHQSSLWQPLDLGPGLYLLEFDFRMVLAPSGIGGSLPDTAFVSIYSFPNAAAFDPADSGTYNAALDVASFDFRGIFAATGTRLGASPKGPLYQRLGFEWQHDGGTFAPVFDLVELNYTDGDSVMVIDNVTVSPVPEPSLVLLLAGTVVWYNCRRRQQRGKIQPFF